MRDDVWLWDILRNIDVSDDPVAGIARNAVFFRKRRDVLNLWKNRPSYHELQDKVKKKTRLTQISPPKDFPVCSDPTGKPIGKHLYEVSKLLSNLQEVWDAEPQYYTLFLGKEVAGDTLQMKRKWIDATTELYRN